MHCIGFLIVCLFVFNLFFHIHSFTETEITLWRQRCSFLFSGRFSGSGVQSAEPSEFITASQAGQTNPGDFQVLIWRPAKRAIDTHTHIQSSTGVNIFKMEQQWTEFLAGPVQCRFGCYLLQLIFSDMHFCACCTFIVIHTIACYSFISFSFVDCTCGAAWEGCCRAGERVCVCLVAGMFAQTG